MSTSEEAGYSGRLRSSTHPNLDAHETGRARSRSRDSRRGGAPEVCSGDETENGTPYFHPDPPTKRVDSAVRAKEKMDQPPPDSGASRRQPSPAPGERHQLPPPRSTGHHRRNVRSPRSTERYPQSSRDRGALAAPWTWHLRRGGPSGRSTTKPEDCTPTSVWQRYRAGEDRFAGGVPGSDEKQTLA